MLSIRDLRHDYGGQAALRLPAWDVARGEAILVLGPSGSGKSTLLAAIAGLLVPTTGTIQVAGASITSMRAAARDAHRARHVGLVPQTLHLIPVIDVRENLRLPRRLAGLPPDDAWLAACMERLGIAHLAHRRAADVSVGEAQRVAIARALANRPALLLADEPTSALDDTSCERVADLLLQESRSTGATLVVATHDRRLRQRFARSLEL
jgi:putative ABC transport system ATP-binding protein